MKRTRRGASSAFLIAVSAFGLLVISRNAMGVSKNGATGDACTIDLPDGLKEPGTVDSKGRCCSVFHTDKCYDIPKPNPASKGALTTNATKKTTAVIQAAPTPTPFKRAPVSEAKSAAPIPSPTPK